MHPGRVRLQFSWPPLFFRLHCLYRSAVRRALILVSIRAGPARLASFPSLRLLMHKGALTRSQIQSRPLTLAPMVGAVNLGLTELATISSYNTGAQCDIP